MTCNMQGVLDVLMAQEGTPRGEGDVSPIGGKLVAYRQSLSEDHAFLKVLGTRLKVMNLHYSNIIVDLQ